MTTMPARLASTEVLGPAQPERDTMDWASAVEAMRLGKHVQRASESGRRLIGHSGGVPIYECGMEPCFLAHAWSDEQRPVRVFCGSGSKALFVPESEHTGATDWMVVEP